MNARVTKATLQNEVERLRAHCDHLETVVASLRATVAATPASRSQARHEATVVRLSFTQRRELSPRYFAAFPDAKSVTDKQLIDFAGAN